LGKARGRILGTSGADNLERAIEHLGAALTVYTREAFPELWAITQNNLGLAYAERIRGARVDNLERAIEHYHQALTIREGFPEPWDRRLRHLSKRRQENAGRTCRITSNRPGCSPASR
jgi:tetratricopeptide (TPR) repeat protein